MIEAALAHQDQTEIRRIYNRSLYMSERTQLMQDWAELLHLRRSRKCGYQADSMSSDKLRALTGAIGSPNEVLAGLSVHHQDRGLAGCSNWCLPSHFYEESGLVVIVKNSR